MYIYIYIYIYVYIYMYICNHASMNHMYVRQLLGLREHSINWNMVGMLPFANQTLAVHASGCTCSVDPRVVCAVHKCQCLLCKKSTSSGDRPCIWRREAMEWIDHYLAGPEGAVSFLANLAVAPRLTYIQFLEMAGKA